MANWGQWLEGISVAWVIIVGAVLFLFPEPLTTLTGAILLLIGVVAFAIGWWQDRKESRRTQGRTGIF